jgi:two-component system, sensor histidine kinase SagS
MGSSTGSPQKTADQKDQSRPKIWIVGGVEGSGVPVADLKERLGDIFEVEVAPAAPLADTAGPMDAQLLLVTPEDLRKLAAAPAAASSMLQAMGQGACLTNPGGQLVWSNTRYLRYDEKTRQQIMEICRESFRHFKDRQHSAVGPESTRRVELCIADGRCYEVIVCPAGVAGVEGRPAKVEAIAAVIREITTDRRLRQKIDAIDQAGAALVRFEADVVRKMSVFERLRLLENKIVKYCKELLRFDHFSIRLVDERTGRLEIVMSSGLPQEALELEIYPAADGNGITGYVAATGRSYICYDAEQDPRFLPGLEGAKASLTVPLRMHDKVIGVFNIESQEVGSFNEDDRQFAEIFGRYVAMALHMLNLLVVERSATNEVISDRVEGELSEPLTDILHEADWFKTLAAKDPEAASHLERIKSDVEAIRRRVRNVAAGPQTLLGVEGALAERKVDPALEGKRILVADDEGNVRRIIHDVLHNRGAEVDTFESGVGAIEALEEAGAGQRLPYNAVLSDIRMPDRNGYEVFAAARRCQPGVPVILMTGFGYDPHHSIVRASQEGLQNVLFKPFQVQRLVEELRKAVTTSL